MKSHGRHVVTTLVVLVVLGVLALGTALFVWSGVYNIGADAPHWRSTHAAIEMLRERSIEGRMRGVQVPDLDDPARIALGAENYSAMCTGCHLSPGAEDTEIRPGLYPMPPDLSRVEREDPRRAFWIIKHGIKMTAMPAWGKTHTDEQIWNMVAFLQKLPGMTPAQYRQLGGKPPEQDDDHMHGGDHPEAGSAGEGSGHWPLPDTMPHQDGMHTHADGTRESHPENAAGMPAEAGEDDDGHGE